jgi:hypothetical protein
MRTNNKSILIVISVFAVLLNLPFFTWAGNLEPSGPPGSTMHTLDDIYNKLITIQKGCIGPNYRFCEMGDGTIQDINSGLIWLKDASCFSLMNWDDAMSTADSLSAGQCGLTDGSVSGSWRLPTKSEWEAFVCTSFNGPAVCNTAGTDQWTENDPFNNVPSNGLYWSSTESTSTARAINIYNGTQFFYYSKSSLYLVWPVRKAN